MKDLFDKVLFAILVTLISTYLLYSYNIYSKSFETAQAQSHPYSTLANKLYGRIADDLTDLTRDVEMDRLKASPQLTDKSREEMLRYAHDIKVRSSALAPTLPNASRIANQISDKLRAAVPEFSTSANFTKQNVDAFRDQVVVLQAEFIKNYFEDIGGILSGELSVFKTSFEKNVPWEARPVTLLIASLTLISLYLIYTFCAWVFGRAQRKFDT